MESPSLHQSWIINSRSGNGAGARLLHAVSQVQGVLASPIQFSDLDKQISLIPPTSTVVVAGGDGTFSAVLGSKEIVSRRVACIPLGTANDLAREVGVTSAIRGAYWQALPTLIATLEPVPFAVWSVSVDGTEYPCANYVSIGYEGAVVADFAAWRSKTKFSGKLTNRAAYTAFGLRHALHKIHGLTITVDDAPSLAAPPTTGLIVTNIKSHLGLGLANAESSPHDDTIECVSIPNVLGFTAMIGASLGILSPPKVLSKGRRLTISGIPEGTAMQIDGEDRPKIFQGTLGVSLRHFVPLLVGAGAAPKDSRRH